MSLVKFFFLIHDLNLYGGQERSTTEIMCRISKWLPVEAHSFTCEDNFGDTSQVVFKAVKPNLKRPVLLKMMLYHFITFLRFFLIQRDKNSNRICATGACSIISDVVHVQFVHAYWHSLEPKRGFYGSIVGKYNLLTERLAFQKNKKYIAISNSVKKSLEQCYQLSNVTVVHHGVDSKRFSPCADGLEKRKLREKLALDLEVTVFLYVGTYERKGLDVSIRAIASLSKVAQSKVLLVAVGAGNEKKFAQLAVNLGVRDRIVFHSPKKNIHEFFQASDLFLFPTKYEPFGLVILEAMACGAVPIVSAVAGASELIEHGRSGYIIKDYNDVVEITHYLADALSDKTKLEAMRIQSRSIAINRSWDIVAKEYYNAALTE